eukprot:scaffold271_cov336-Pavlova_lutheri.AAC.29
MQQRWMGDAKPRNVRSGNGKWAPWNSTRCVCFGIVTVDPRRTHLETFQHLHARWTNGCPSMHTRSSLNLERIPLIPHGPRGIQAGANFSTHSQRCTFKSGKHGHDPVHSQGWKIGCSRASRHCLLQKGRGPNIENLKRQRTPPQSRPNASLVDGTECPKCSQRTQCIPEEEAETGTS